jgi:type II secretory ATPase GspE/PulE/Tfp pilus assembly ATPase PilB-like protein
MAAFLKTANSFPPVQRSLEEQLAYQKRLNEITNKIHSARDTADILINLQSEILGIFDADRITIYIVDGLRKEIVSRLKTGDEIAEIRVPIDNGSLAGYGAVSGKVLNIRNAYDEGELRSIHPHLRFDSSWDRKTGYKTTQVLVAPIVYSRYLLGVIQLINKKTGPQFTDEDQISATDIGQVLGIAFFNNQKLAQKAKPTRFDYLITNNIIGSRDLSEAMTRARTAKRSVESVLMSDFQVSRDDIGRSLSVFFNTRFIAHDEKRVIPGELLKGLRANYLRTNVFVPVAQDGDKVVIAMEDPNYLPARDAVKRILTGKRFEYCVALKEDIFKMINHFFDVRRGDFQAAGSIEDILGRLEPVDEESSEDQEGLSEEDSAIVQLVNKMIIDAHSRGASDIHIEPRHGKANALIRFRIDGACQVYQTIPFTYKRAIVSRIKIMSDLDISERRLPQDGKIKFRKFAPLDIELRVATVPTSGQNEDVVMRLLAAGEPIPLEKMGMSEHTEKAFLDIISKPYGIVLVVGPTGSGKTTTLHAALAHINRPETKIWTAEDPVEISQEGLRQVQVASKIGFDFATAMRAFLRADPDVIMVGEMRDHETASVGIEASLTGHLVFSTLHTNSAPETIVRLLDMGMDPFNFADALLGVLAQRLVRTLCSGCKEAYRPGKEEFNALVRAYDGDFDRLGIRYSEEFTLFRARGCSACGNTGYRGRTGIHELLAGTEEIKSLIQNRSRVDDIRRQAIKDGMMTLMQDGIRKVCLGLTDLLQVRKVCIK